jgi:hypothetical protein
MRLDEIRKWLNTAMAEREMPPIFEVQPPEFHAENDRKRFSDIDVRVNRRRDSGVLEIRFNRTEGRRVVNLAQTAMAIARDEDPERNFSELRRVHEESQFLVSKTLIRSLPVLGPGGQVLIQDSGTAFMADITIRRRHLKGIASEEWNAPEFLYRSLTVEFGDYPDNVDIQAQLGYCELSKYDDQSFIRPVFMFLVRSHSAPSEKSYAAWETVRFQPATLNKSVGEREGLGVSE